MTPRKDDAASLSGAYALNALDAAERAHFEAHLADNEETRNEVTELSDTAVLLGLAVQPVNPPGTLRESILGKLASTPQLAREAEPAPVFATPAQTRAETKAQARWFTRPITAVVGIAAAVAIIVGGSVVANTLGTTTFQQQQADQLAAINSADDSQRVVTAMDGGATATLVWSTDLKSSAFIVDGLGALPADKVYELWYIDAVGARAAGTFTVADSGKTWRVLDGKMGFGDTVAVTVEPSGGSKTPSSDPIVVIASA